MSSSPESDSSDAALTFTRPVINADHHRNAASNINLDDDVDQFDDEFESQGRHDSSTPWDSGGEEDATHVRRPQSNSIFNPTPSKYQKLQYDTIAPPAAVHHPSLHSSIVRPHYLHSYETPKLPNQSERTPTIDLQSHQARIDQPPLSVDADVDPKQPPLPCSSSPLLLCVTLMGLVFILCGVLVGISLSVQPKREDHVALYNAAVEGWNKVERATFSHASFTIELRSPIVDVASMKPSSLYQPREFYHQRRLLQEATDPSTAGPSIIGSSAADSSVSSDTSTAGSFQSSTATDTISSSSASGDQPDSSATVPPISNESSTGSQLPSAEVSFSSGSGGTSSSSDITGTPPSESSTSTGPNALSTGERSTVDSSTASLDTTSSGGVTAVVEASSSSSSRTGDISSSSSGAGNNSSSSSADGSHSSSSSSSSASIESNSSGSSISGSVSESSTGSVSTSSGDAVTSSQSALSSSTADSATTQPGPESSTSSSFNNSSSTTTTSVGNSSSSTSDSSSTAVESSSSSSTGAESSSSTGGVEPVVIPTTNPTVDPWFVRANQTQFNKRHVGDALNDGGVDVAKYQPLFFSLSAAAAVSSAAYATDATESMITPFPTPTYDELPPYLMRNYSQARQWIDREDFSLNHTTIRIQAATPSSSSYSSSDPLATNALEISLPFLRQDLSKTSALSCSNRFFGLYDTVHGTCLSFRQLNSICLRITHATVDQIKRGWKLKSQQMAAGTVESSRAAASNPNFASAVLNSTVANNATRWIFDDEELPGWYEAMGDEDDTSDSNANTDGNSGAALLLTSTVTTPYWYDSQGETSIGDTTPDGDGLDTHKATVPGCVRHDSGWQLGVYVPVRVTKFTPTASGSITGGGSGKNQVQSAHTTWKVSAHQLLKRFPQLAAASASANSLPFSFENVVREVSTVDNAQTSYYQRRVEEIEADNDPSGSSTADMYLIHLNLPSFNITVRSRADPYLMAQSLTSSSLWFGFPASELILFTVLLIFMGLLMEIAPAYHFARWWAVNRRNKRLAEEETEDGEDEEGEEDDDDLELSDVSSEDDQLHPKKESSKLSANKSPRPQPQPQPQHVVKQPSVDIQMTQLNVRPPSPSHVRREAPISSRSDSHELDPEEELALALAMEASPQPQQTEDEMDAIDM